MPFRKVTDQPLFGQPPGTLSDLTNMELIDGYAQPRGGFAEDKPLNLAASDAISAGGYSHALQVSSPYGWVRSYDEAAAPGAEYSANRYFHQGGWLFFPTGVVNDAVYFGADLPFSRIMVSTSVAGVFSLTIVYEYWTGAAWSALTTAETLDLTLLRTPTFASWTMPTNWVARSVGDSGTGNVVKYWMRVRISAAVSFTTAPRVGLVQMFSAGMRETYVTTTSPRTSATSGAMKRMDSGATREWFNVGSSLFSGNASPARMAAYRGRVVMVNGKETKRWDGANFRDLGIEPFVYLAGTHNFLNVAGGVLGAGIWRYYVAFGEGPCLNTDAYADRQDVRATYGPGRAAYTVEVTTAAAERVRIEFAGFAIPAGVSSVYIYRTDDLTNVATADRGNAPAYLIQSLRVQNTQFEQGLGGVGNYYYDDNLAPAFPYQEAYTFDIAPPARCKFAAVFQNRLFLMDEDTVYWSDPFLIDRFTGKATTAYLRLNRAQGGRNMGMLEFADQLVAFTENQTWGIGNVDLDIPQLFPVHPDVGCVAPDATATGDGALIWAARDGIYLWDGGRVLPKKISKDKDDTFQKLRYENHGGSRAVIHNRRYDVILLDPVFEAGATTNWRRFSFDSGQWSENTQSFSHVLAPIGVVHGPIDGEDPGVLHPLWGKVNYQTVGGEYGLFYQEQTTQDAGANFTASATMHFQIPPSAVYTPKRILAYYYSDGCIGTPSFTSLSSDIGSAVGTLNTGTPDTGTDYSVISGTFSQVGRGSSDLVVKISASSAATGAAGGAQFFGAVMHGVMKEFRRGF